MIAFCALFSAGASAIALRQEVAAVVGRDLKIGFPAVKLETQLQLLTPLSALPAEAGLRVTSTRAGFSRDTWLLRLACRSTRECLPFYALLRCPECQDVDGLRRAASAASAREHPATLTRTGEHVEIVEQLSGLRMKTRAVCLQSGGLGERVRVRNESSQRVLTAIVIGPKLLAVEPE
ncbi:MAG TPA: flagella basal body P-ring formation protein FlgA [Chloroflexota bacterium]|nr:flagella basal body P-ring formation protein FlgA [Chloroflexota bacterium]